MIKAVIFDFYGVLVTEGTGSFARKYFPDDAEKLAKTATLQDEFNLGTISYRDYAKGLANLAGVEEQVALDYLEGHKPNEPLLDYIRNSLKPKYKIGIISNAGDDWISELLAPEDVALFDKKILSYQAGFIKPQPAIYELALRELGIQAAEAVFIDDIERYCQGARDVGMQAIWYGNFDKVKAELEKILSAGSDN